MTISTDINTETTDISDVTDVFSDTLQTMRISGSLLLTEEYVAPWAVTVPSADSLAKQLNIGPGSRIAAFHLVERGYLEITLEDGERMVAQAGELVICFAGASHRLSQGASSSIMAFTELFAGADNRFKPSEANRPIATSLLCGGFVMHDTTLNPLFAALPPLLKVSLMQADGNASLPAITQLLLQEVQQGSMGSQYTIARYLELLCAEALRQYVKVLPKQSAGWLTAIRDPIVGRAIAMIHQAPGKAWSVNALAQQVALSQSRFAARFVATLGEPPMVYVTKWRMYLASRLLEAGNKSVEQISAEVGYESAAAFSRAFKRYMCVTPAQWQAQG